MYVRNGGHEALSRTRWCHSLVRDHQNIRAVHLKRGRLFNTIVNQRFDVLCSLFARGKAL